MAAHLCKDHQSAVLYTREIAGFEPRNAGVQPGDITNEPSRQPFNSFILDIEVPSHSPLHLAELANQKLDQPWRSAWNGGGGGDGRREKLMKCESRRFRRKEENERNLISRFHYLLRNKQPLVSWAREWWDPCDSRLGDEWTADLLGMSLLLSSWEWKVMGSSALTTRRVVNYLSSPGLESDCQEMRELHVCPLKIVEWKVERKSC